jgi:hypothetical protein
MTAQPPDTGSKAASSSAAEAKPDSSTQAQSVMKQFSKTDHEIDHDESLPQETAPGTQGKNNEPNDYKAGTKIDRPGTLTPHAGSEAEKFPSEGGAP